MISTTQDLQVVESRAKRQFPDYESEIIFPVCWPVYELRLTATVMESSHLSTAARFVLRSVDLGISKPSEIGRILGLSDKYVAGAAAELLSTHTGLVQQGPDLALKLTDQGKNALADSIKLFRPRRFSLKVPFDPLLKIVPELDVEDLLDRDLVRSAGLFVIPGTTRKPRLNQIRIDEVKEASASDPRIKDPSEVLEVTDIKAAKLRFRADFVIAKLVDRQAGRVRFAVYRALQYQEDESDAIQRLADRGLDIVPDELQSDQASPWKMSTLTTQEEERLLTEIDDLDLAVREIEKQSESADIEYGTTQHAEERAQLESRISDLESEKKSVEVELAKREVALAELTGSNNRLIFTDQHRPLLIQAISTSTRTLVLVSAWVRPDAFDAEICKLLAEAIQRGVTVQIAWGLGANNRGRGSEAQRNREIGELALENLRKLISREGRERLVVKRTDTHEKFIICDDTFCAWGSFNWLSYRGERGDGFRRETSYYSERPEDIQLWVANTASIFR